MARFRVSDFDRLGSDTGFRYRLLRYSGSKKGRDDVYLAKGSVQQYEMKSGLQLIISNIAVHRAYEATSLAPPKFCAIVMLQGEANALIEPRSSINLVARRGATIACSDSVSLTGIHSAGQTLRSVSISVRDQECIADSRLGEAVAIAMATEGTHLRQWATPNYLLQALEQLMNNPWQGVMQDLLLDGLSLQLLASAVADYGRPPFTHSPALSIRDKQLLERVRERLYHAPGDDHSLEALAKLACMSPSSLRVKFRAAYRKSVFNWLRERRMEVAREHLAQGWRVQEAAAFVGYRHAANFATAFRRQYGIAPSKFQT